MRVPIFQLDAFTTRRFAGNPAAVVVLDRFLDDALLQAVAAENNLAETAFVVPSEGRYRLRWFTPTVEVPLCGHATLAAGAVVVERLEPGRDSVVFDTASGPLTVDREGTGVSDGTAGSHGARRAAAAGVVGRARRHTGGDGDRREQLPRPAPARPTTSGPSNRTSPRSPAWTGPGSW